LIFIYLKCPVVISVSLMSRTTVPFQVSINIVH